MKLDDVLVQAHEYWCGVLHTADQYPADKAEIWFERKDATDQHIRETFGPYLDAVAAEAWNLDALSREAQIGLVIFLDQFPRNLFREDGRAFAYDATARRHAEALIAGGVDRFALVERIFLYLPLEHSEAPDDQARSVELYVELADAAPPAQAEIYREYIVYAEKHRDLIERFGRFPHRNAVLGRPSTSDELAFLAEHGRGY